MNHFEKVIGYEHIKLELERIIDVINNKEKYEKLGVRIPKGLLLHGRPGLGKSLTAKSLVEALNVNKYIIRKNMPDGQFVNYLREIITKAMENTPSAILLDDIDKFSNNDDEHPNSDEFIVIQTLIDDAKDKDVYFIATANNLRDMPESLLRAGRFDTRIEFDNPSVEDSKLIIKHYLKDKKLANDIDYEEIAKIISGKSCAVLETVMNEAGLYAGFHNKSEIGMDDIIEALLRVIFDSPMKLNDKTDYANKIAAYHEAGHALVSEILEPNSVNLVTIANYAGDKGGITSSNMDEDYWYDINKMENRVRVLLAGKAAIDLVFNKLDVGTMSDLARVNQMVSRFIYCYGMDEMLSNERYDGAISDKQWSICDTLINNKIKKYYQEAKDILYKNKEKLEKLSLMLMEKKILRHKDIASVLEKQ